ncbi:hypothetical protein K431DRAFT_299322 [Polychaeton citri CBS 116435]|uniref:Uncharacterized protein n=1 Tax=Polychaeton citri CBS 116435 TaxID=1314669 RepID=A0A9P4UUW4_9PEZI|nr:hypothetical protein K431DRAFT_299322 [Polychaeton citri CBS 116435]
MAQDSSKSSSNDVSIASSTNQPPYNSPASRSTGTSTSTSTITNIGGSDGDDSQTHDRSDTVINYYFIFLALILCFVGLAAFFILKRRRKAMMRSSHSRQDALARDIYGWGSTDGAASSWGGQRYWPGGRWRSVERPERDEGLNEHGEAPPPYIPKREEESGGAGASGESGPAIPLQTLNRAQVGLSKPPDYTQTDVLQTSVTSSDGEPNSSRAPQETSHSTETTPSTDRPHR